MNPEINIPTIALAGQPNTGKSTVFNSLTGSKQHVGNWPGKTVEKKTGTYRYNGSALNIVDLPGTYSLTSASLEEKIARDFLLNERPDAVVVMADASQLERTLYLFTEIRLLKVPVVLALNMMDVAREQGKNIDVSALQENLGVPVVPMTASRAKGLDDLISVINNSLKKKNGSPALCMEDNKLLNKYSEIYSLLDDEIPNEYSKEWIAVKLIEKDEEANLVFNRYVSGKKLETAEKLVTEIKDGILHVAGARYNWIRKAILNSIKLLPSDEKKIRRKNFDRAATHPIWGKFIAVGIILLTFITAMIIAIPVMSVAQLLMGPGSGALRDIFSGAPLWVISFFADGLLPVTGVAVMMFSFILGVYFAFGILEDIGYLARLAYVFDRPMNRIGLHGKSFMPLLMSFGCNIAGVTGTRVIDSWQQRMVTLVMVSIIPCMALWAVVSFVGVIFFGAAMPLLIIALLAVVAVHLTFTSALFRKFIVKGEKTGLIMELPPYHKPNWKTIWSYVWVHSKDFLKRAGTLIALISLAVWALSYQHDGNIENSILAAIGKFFDPVSGLIGLDWKLFIALIAAIAAKEASLSVLAVLYGIGDGASSITSLFVSGTGGFENAALTGAIAQSVSPASALAFIFAFFFSIPCIGTVATIYSETRSFKWTAGCSAYYLLASFIAGGIAYRIGLMIF
ncbi:MAG: ferrous iron transport protein B [Spirochaetes bacterium]|nr:ferrous iron transport protein B [Spirochaetota bacterium]